MKNLRKIKGDASFRKFFRRKYENNSSIIVFSKKEKNKNLLVYDAINKILIKNKILAPNLYQENYSKNFIEIEDFGDDTIFKILTKKNNKLFYFKKIIQILNKIQNIKDKNIKNFKNETFIIPKYKKEVLIKEANLFCEWYSKKKLPKNDMNNFIRKFKKITKSLSENLKLKNNVFVHRDFHISNLMLVKNKIGILDSQDALLGNRAYDVASLIDDVRLKTSKSFKNKVYKLYIRKQNKLPPFQRFISLILTGDNEVKLEKEGYKFKTFIEDKLTGKILGPVSAPIFRIKKKYRVRLLIRGAKTLKLQNSLAAAIRNYKFQPGIKLSVDVDPINFN